MRILLTLDEHKSALAVTSVNDTGNLYVRRCLRRQAANQKAPNIDQGVCMSSRGVTRVSARGGNNQQTTGLVYSGCPVFDVAHQEQPDI